MAGNSKTPGRSVISKVSAILLTVAENSRSTLTEIAARSELPLSTTHRLVAELAGWGVLERTRDGRLRAGPPLRTISEACGCGSGDTVASIRELAAPVMDDLFRVTGTRVRMGYLDGTTVAYVEKTSAHVPISEVRPARLPAHATALGKALLAFTSPRSAAPILAGELRQYTPRTVTHADRLRLDLRTVRATRLAVCDGELEPRCCAVAAPVLGPAGSLVVALELHVRNLARDVPAWRPALEMAAGALSRDLSRHGEHVLPRPESLAPPALERMRARSQEPLTGAGSRRAGSAAGSAAGSPCR